MSPTGIGSNVMGFLLETLNNTPEGGQVQLCRLNSKPRKFPNLCRESQEFPNGLLSKYRVISHFELGAGAANKVIDALIASIFKRPPNKFRWQDLAKIISIGCVASLRQSVWAVWVRVLHLFCQHFKFQPCLNLILARKLEKLNNEPRSFKEGCPLSLLL